MGLFRVTETSGRTQTAHTLRDRCGRIPLCPLGQGRGLERTGGSPSLLQPLAWPGLASPGADNEQLRARPHQPDPRVGGSATVRLWATAGRPLGLSFLRCEWAMRAPPRVAVRDEPKPLQCGLAQSRGYSGHLCGVQKVPRRLGPALEEPRVQNSVAAEGPAHL